MRVLLAVALALPLLNSTGAAQQQPTLYQRLGGFDAIAAVTDNFIVRIAVERM